MKRNDMLTAVAVVFGLFLLRLAWNHLPHHQPLEARAEHAAVLLKNGQILFIGGSVGPSYEFDRQSVGWCKEHLSFHLSYIWMPFDTGLTTCELFNPDTGTWRYTGSLQVARCSPSATLLDDGRVLVCDTATNDTATCEIYDPTCGTWSDFPSLLWAGNYISSTQNGQILAFPSRKIMHQECVPGIETAPEEAYLSAIRSWQRINFIPGGLMFPPIKWKNGIVFSVSNLNPKLVLDVRHLSDSSEDKWSPPGNYPMDGCPASNAVLLQDGQVLIFGHFSDGDARTPFSKLYNTHTQQWHSVALMKEPRFGWPTATLLQNGQVLVAGGYDAGAYLSECELYDPKANVWTVTGSLKEGRDAHSATLLPSGKVLVLGGRKLNNQALASCEFYDARSGTWGPK